MTMTATAFRTQRIRSAIVDLRGFWRRIKTAFIFGLVVAFVLATIIAAVLWAVNAARNRTIAALMDNHDVTVANDSAPEVLFARAYFLMTHARLDEAQLFVSMLDIRGSERMRADLHYDMANGRLKLAFDKIEAGDFNAAAALVALAREDYREALRLDPGGWNTRFNFDVASRLVREYPTFGFTPDERRRGPRPLWTELPNTPRGEP
jgi:mxaK protein